MESKIRLSETDGQKKNKTNKRLLDSRTWHGERTWNKQTYAIHIRQFFSSGNADIANTQEVHLWIAVQDLGTNGTKIISTGFGQF
jgi:hypothetical protein